MHDAIACNNSTQVTEFQDKRITRVGKWLRRFRLDELPQCWNILRGEMSLIGPRPEQQELVEQFTNSIPYYDFRHTVLPGITGWAQVEYGYAALEIQNRDKLEYDLFYIKHMSLWLDITILFQTARTIVLGTGAR
jgi:lipopolysaccharide/colanic/teichoic acid biosynthesis glycosyltransferase